MWKPIRDSSFGTLLLDGRAFRNIRIRLHFDGSGRSGSSPFLRRFLHSFLLVAEVLGSLRGIGQIDLFRFDLVFVHHSNPRRTFVLPTCWSLFGRGFLRPITLIEDRRRREISPLREWRFTSRRTVVQGRRGIFAPSHHRRC